MAAAKFTQVAAGLGMNAVSECLLSFRRKVSGAQQAAAWGRLSLLQHRSSSASGALARLQPYRRWNSTGWNKSGRCEWALQVRCR